MSANPNWRTWQGSRGNRLKPPYPQDYPLHATICTRGGRRLFLKGQLAETIFQLVIDEEQTAAACLMPDHLHWILSDASHALETIRGFKSLSTHVGWRENVQGKLWQRSFWDHVIRRDENLRAVAEYIVQNPVRAGLVTVADQYPYRLIRL